MTAEMQMLVQLACAEGGPVPMGLAMASFGSVERAQRALLAFSRDRVIEALEEDLAPIPEWKVLELCRMLEKDWLAATTTLKLRITDVGLRKYPGLG